MDKLFFAFIMLFSALSFAACGNDDKDEPGNSGNESGVNSVVIGTEKFDTKFSYLVFDAYDDPDSYTLMCTDTDLSNIFEGKPLNKTMSYVQFFFESGETPKLMGLFGGYKYDPDNDEYGSDGMSFSWPSGNNPEGIITLKIKGNQYSLEGKDLLVGWNRTDPYDEPLGELPLKFTINTNPVKVTLDDTRSGDITVIDDPEKVKLLKRFLPNEPTSDN